MRVPQYSSDRLLEAIQASVRAEMEAIVAEEAERAAQRVKEKLDEIAPRLVMKMFNNFDVSRHESQFIIKVRHTEGAN